MDSDCQSTRVNTYMLLSNLVGRFNQNDGHSLKNVGGNRFSLNNLGGFEEGAMEEDVLQFDD